MGPSTSRLRQANHLRSGLLLLTQTMDGERRQLMEKIDRLLADRTFLAGLDSNPRPAASPALKNWPKASASKICLSMTTPDNYRRPRPSSCRRARLSPAARLSTSLKSTALPGPCWFFKAARIFAAAAVSIRDAIGAWCWRPEKLIWLSGAGRRERRTWMRLWWRPGRCWPAPCLKETGRSWPRCWKKKAGPAGRDFSQAGSPDGQDFSTWPASWRGGKCGSCFAARPSGSGCSSVK